MSDVRAKLAEALRGHQRNPYGQHDGWWECSCSTDEPHTPEHLADVLLSLEGVAIAALPERLTHRDGHSWKADGDSVYFDTSDNHVAAVVLDSSAGEAQLVYPKNARAFAAALLAAAEAATDA